MVSEAENLHKLAKDLAEELSHKLVFCIAYREQDHVTLGDDGLATLRFLVSEGRGSHSKWLKEHLKSDNEWKEMLKFSDKVVERLISAAKKVTVEVDWDKWYKIEKELNREMKKFHR